jgi:hypothetical protein
MVLADHVKFAMASTPEATGVSHARFRSEI